MRETEYAFAVARVRANEPFLLTAEEISQLISAPDEQTARRLLEEKGWADGEGGKDIYDTRAERAWVLIKSSVPDPELLEAMIIGNDFANVKAAIKSVFSGIEPEKYMVYPCLCDTAEIIRAVKENDFSALPDYLAQCADDAYHTISSGGSGLAAEMIIDKASLETRLRFAEKSGSGLLKKLVGLSALLANLKIAKRCFSTGKSADFALESMCECSFMSNEELVKKVYAGEELSEFAKEAGFECVADEIDGDFSSLEMKVDNTVAQMITEAKYETFGPDPIVQFYYATLSEIKNVRIILSAKADGVPLDTIKQRVREVYV